MKNLTDKNNAYRKNLQLVKIMKENANLYFSMTISSIKKCEKKKISKLINK